jgi:hypothetical protein
LWTRIFEKKDPPALPSGILERLDLLHPFSSGNLPYNFGSFEFSERPPLPDFFARGSPTKNLFRQKIKDKSF